MTGVPTERPPCCFCGEPIATTPRTITLDPDSPVEGGQRLYAHPACLREHLHPLAKPVVVEAGGRVRPRTVGSVVKTFLFWVLILLVPIMLIQLTNRGR